VDAFLDTLEHFFSHDSRFIGIQTLQKDATG
jgi:hypothetical protein